MNYQQSTLINASLDIRPTKLAAWTPKQRRAYHRLLSGIKRAEALGRQLRFFTLTSSPTSDYWAINDHFQILRKRIERRFRCRIEYWKIRTNEGHGVLHVVYTGRFIPQRWLSEQWEEIHGAKVVDIRMFRFGSKRLARYLVSNYLCKQSFERMSWSWRWVFRGFVSVWRAIKDRLGYPRALAYWDWLLSLPEIPTIPEYIQLGLT